MLFCPVFFLLVDKTYLTVTGTSPCCRHINEKNMVVAAVLKKIANIFYVRNLTVSTVIKDCIGVVWIWLCFYRRPVPLL